MVIKSHLCGVAVAFDRWNKTEDYEEPKRQFFNSSTNNFLERPQGSLYSWQKRKIADACEYMRTQSTYKPIIFVATSPGFTNLASEGKLISKLTANLKNGYYCKNFVWVREFTGNGFPHFHFVADMPDFDALKLSSYWSGLFGSDANNSIRLGTAPKCSKCSTKLKFKGQTCYRCKEGIGKVEYYLKGKKMAWYMTKYLSKSIGSSEEGALKGKRSFRKFAVSKQLAALSAPIEYEGKMVRTTERQVMKADGKFYPFYEDERQWFKLDSERNATTETMTEPQVKKKWNWQYTGFAYWSIDNFFT